MKGWFLWVVLGLVSLTGNLTAQEELKGMVLNRETGEPVTGATIQAIASGQGTISALDGRFSLEAIHDQDSIIVSHIGFIRQILPVSKGSGVIHILLVPANLDIDPVVVTSTRTRRQASDAPVSLDLIPNGMVRSYPGLKVYEALGQVTGLNLNRQGGIFTLNPVISLRGMPGDDQVRTLVLIDGLPVNISDNGEVRWNMFNRKEAGQMEIQKGPGSALYGNNAMGGVIHLVSRPPVLGISGHAGVSYGSYNTFINSAGINLRNRKGLYGGLGYHYLNSDGYNDVPDHLRGNPDYSVPRFLKERGLSGRFGYARSEALNIDLSFDYYRDKRGEGEKVQAPEGGYRSFNNEHIRMRIFGRERNWSYQAGMYFMHEAYSDLNERMRGAQYTRYDVLSDRFDYGGILQAGTPVIRGHRLTGGLETRAGSVNGGDYYQTLPYDTMLNSGKIISTAFFIQDEWSPVPGRISVIGGLRYDLTRFSDGSYYTNAPWNNLYPVLDDHSWDALSPRLLLLARPFPSLATSLGYSHGFRTAVLDDLTRTGFMLLGPKYANPSLAPEKLDNLELGIKYSLDSTLVLKASGYYGTGNGFHYYVNTGDTVFGRPVYRKENLSRVGITGFEASADCRTGWGLSLHAGYSFNRSVIKHSESRPELEGKYLKYVPAHQIKAGISYRSRILSGTILTRYKSSQYMLDDNAETDRFGDPAIIGEYLTADVSIWKDWKFMEFRITVTNIADLQYLDNALYLAPGRMVSATLGIEF
jgi:iron complex outermembrane receptor protein